MNNFRLKTVFKQIKTRFNKKPRLNVWNIRLFKHPMMLFCYRICLSVHWAVNFSSRLLASISNANFSPRMESNKILRYIRLTFFLLFFNFDRRRRRKNLSNMISSNLTRAKMKKTNLNNQICMKFSSSAALFSNAGMAARSNRVSRSRKFSRWLPFWRTIKTSGVWHSTVNWSMKIRT